MNSRDQFEESYSKVYGTPKIVLENLRQTHGDDYRETDGDRLSRAWCMWKASRNTYDSLAMQNMKDIAYCLSDLRRFIEMKWPTIADLPSVEGVLLNGPENKHEVDALIAALNRVADFYENDRIVVELPERLSPVENNPEYYMVPDPAGDYLNRNEVIEVLNAAGVTVKSD